MQFNFTIAKRMAVLVILGVFAVLLLREPDTAGESAALERKNYPYEYFYLQRAYPDPYPDIKAIEKGLLQARQMAALRSTTFNEPWTQQGPGNIGARINTVAVHPKNENIIYVGFSHGGVWKTLDGGINWVPLFDNQLWLAIGDIVIDPKNPEVVYVATGDPNISWYPMLGDGLYKSTNGGATFTRIGLAEHRILTKILLHPTDPKTLYVASMGLPFLRGKDRGLYKTTDGGNTWKQVLFINDQAGVTDVVFDPFNPNVLYAAGWDRIRTNKESVITGPGSRVYKTLDAGNTWTMVQNGLPQIDLGRTALAISATTPGVVYVRYVGLNSQLIAIYKTVNGGDTWNLININGLGTALGGFGWYFGRIELNPANDNELFLLGVSLYRRNPADGEWKIANTSNVHVDMHDLLFTASGNMYLATDGGLYKSLDNGVSWIDIENIPATQFYRVAYNPHKPQLYYGGTQDNGTISGNAAGINNWNRIYGGDGFLPVFHPSDSSVFFVETQNGGIAVTTNGGTSFSAGDKGIESGDRRNWDMPYFMSLHNPKVMYAATFRVYKSTSGSVVAYSPISNDLTDGLIFNARHHNITSMSESPFQQGLLYIGTSDGNVWRTDNDGISWNNAWTGLPDRYVTEVKASPFHKDWAYVSHSGYRDNEFIPRIHRTKNKGVSWENISSDLPNIAINDLYVLPNNRDSILFVATDAGVYITVNSGASWQRLGSDMPFVPAFDLEVNVAQRTLMVGTFARSLLTYSLNNITSGALTPTGQRNYTAGLVKFSPNPATGLLAMEFPETVRTDAEIRIFASNGQEVLMDRISSGSKSYSLRVADWKPGLYFSTMRIDGKHYSGKFIKQ